MKKKEYLIPLSYLLQVKRIENINLNNDGAEHIKNYYNIDVRQNIYNSLKEFEGVDVLEYDFQALLEGSSLMGPIMFSNQEIYDYIIKFKSFMENEEYGLLTDDRLPNRPWEQD